MYSQQIEKLIELALADGELTEKEKQVLLKKADAEGIDMDEFEMALDAKLHNRQKEGVNSTNKDNVIKCPACSDIIPGLSRVCPSCDFVIDARKTSSQSEIGLEELIGNIENTLVSLKSIPQANIFRTLQERSYISVPLLTILMCAFALNSFLGILICAVLAYVSYGLIKSKISQGFSKGTNKNQEFSNLKANFEKYSRTAKTLFGDNKKVKLLLEELNNELIAIEVKRKKATKVELIGYSAIALIVISIFTIPKLKKDTNGYEGMFARMNVDAETRNKESLLVAKAENLIKESKIDEVNTLLNDIKSEDNIIHIRSKIQLANLNKQLEALEPLLITRDYSNIKLKLSKIIWEKISIGYSTVSTERDVYKSFLERKKALNKQLPKNFQIGIESEFSL